VVLVDVFVLDVNIDGFITALLPHCEVPSGQVYVPVRYAIETLLTIIIIIYSW